MLIFVENVGMVGSLKFCIMEQVFGEKLYIYMIVDVISDKNVLLFCIDYVNMIKLLEGIIDKQVLVIDIECVLLVFEWVCQVVLYVFEYFDQKIW